MRMNSIRILAVILAALAAAQFPAAAQSSRPLPRRSNIILIVADGLGAGDLSCYGQTQFQTPNLDKLAANGIRFTHDTAGAAASGPAWAALLLGKNVGSAGVPLSPGDVTIAQVLKNSGYYTCWLGDWDLGDQNSSGAPWRKGIDEFAGYFNPADIEGGYPGFIWRYEPGHSRDAAPAFNGPETVYSNAGGKKARYVPDWMMTLEANFTRGHIPKRLNHYQPFFLVINCPLPDNGKGVVPTDAPYSEEGWPPAEKIRAAMISRMDGYIGQLVEQLHEVNQESNTVIFFTSDVPPKKANGIDPEFFHENAAPDSLNVPLIACWPGKIPAGQVSGMDCSARDFLPTAADIAFLKSPAGVEGVSLLPVLLGQAPK